ncbi:hypothetical protein KC330_g173 [Hortaea werneckii]|nr:hypothetical protein KC330_g173 [Hortaea werneckii]
MRRSCSRNAVPWASSASRSISPTRIPPPLALPLMGWPVNAGSRQHQHRYRRGALHHFALFVLELERRGVLRKSM